MSALQCSQKKNTLQFRRKFFPAMHFLSVHFLYENIPQYKTKRSAKVYLLLRRVFCDTKREKKQEKMKCRRAAAKNILHRMKDGEQYRAHSDVREKVRSHFCPHQIRATVQALRRFLQHNHQQEMKYYPQYFYAENPVEKSFHRCSPASLSNNTR